MPRADQKLDYHVYSHSRGKAKSVRDQNVVTSVKIRKELGVRRTLMGEETIYMKQMVKKIGVTVMGTVVVNLVRAFYFNITSVRNRCYDSERLLFPT